MNRRPPIFMVAAATAVAGTSAHAQAAASASVNATARFVDPVGVTSIAEPGLATAAKSARGVQAALTPGALDVGGPEHQAFSVETTERPVLRRAQGLGQVRLDLSATRDGSKIQLDGRLAGAEAIPAGVYAGQLRTVVNFN